MRAAAPRFRARGVGFRHHRRGRRARDACFPRNERLGPSAGHPQCGVVVRMHGARILAPPGAARPERRDTGYVRPDEPSGRIRQGAHRVRRGEAPGGAPGRAGAGDAARAEHRGALSGRCGRGGAPHAVVRQFLYGRARARPPRPWGWPIRAAGRCGSNSCRRR